MLASVYLFRDVLNGVQAGVSFSFFFLFFFAADVPAPNKERKLKRDVALCRNNPEWFNYDGLW